MLVRVKTVTLNFAVEELERLDKWAAARRLKRNAAILSLLDLAEGADEERVARRQVREPEVSKDSIAAAIKAEALKQALRLTEKRLGVAPVEVAGDKVVKKRDPYDQTPEFADEDTDQRRRR